MGEPIEERMMAEWAAANLTPGTWTSHVDVGRPRELPASALSEAQRSRLAKLLLPQADLVVRTPGSTEATIIEFVVWRPTETLGQLLFYGSRLPLTPGYEDLTAVHLRIVSGVEQAEFREMAEALGIGLEVYRPAWLLEALAARTARHAPR